MTKFFEEFTAKSNEAFPELKFNSATYYKDKHALDVRFIISAFDSKLYDDKKKAEVQKIVEEIFNGIAVNIVYIRTYADKTVVTNKIYEFFNKYEQLVFGFLKEENISVVVENKEINIQILFDSPTYVLLKNNETNLKLKEFLDEQFNGEIDVQFVEKVVDPAEIKVEDIMPKRTFTTGQSFRLIKTEGCSKVYARGKLSGVNQMPNYICDIKNPAENVVLCGKISGIQHKEYKNKKYNPSDPNSREPEMKPMFRCVIDDTTAKIECVCFPRQSDVDALKVLEENDEVICVGNVSISSYNGALSYALDGIFRCSIQFDSIQRVQNKPCPAKYSKVFPEPYSAVSQDSIFGEATVPEFLKDKTFVIFDFEATDKYINTAEPIELAAVKMVDGKITEVFQSFAKPSEPISDFITGLTSITNEMVRFSPKFEDILPDFFKFTRDSILVGHNISGYDYPLLEKYAREEGYKFDNDMVDTLLLAREHLKEFKRFDLESLSKNLNISHENAHRAIADVYATAELLKVLAKRIS